MCVQCGFPGVETPAAPAPAPNATPAAPAPAPNATPAAPAPAPNETPAAPVRSETPAPAAPAPIATTPATSAPVFFDVVEVPLPAALAHAIEEAAPLLRSGITQIARAAVLILRAVVTVARDEPHP
jgi:2-oxoglutarate dehydrogenase E2 component (dihydrolipoamide succinyltransferase)